MLRCLGDYPLCSITKEVITVKNFNCCRRPIEVDLLRRTCGGESVEADLLRRTCRDRHVEEGEAVEVLNFVEA